MNPYDRAATVEVRYLQETGLSQPYTFTVLPRRRFTVAPPITGAFGIDVRSVATGGAVAVPIIAERAMYFGQPWNIGHATEGATSPSQRWMFAEGSTEGGRFYDPYLLLANPSTVDARVRLDFRLSDGSVFSDTVIVGAGRRRTVIPWDYDGAQEPAVLDRGRQRGDHARRRPGGDRRRARDVLERQHRLVRRPLDDGHAVDAAQRPRVRARSAIRRCPASRLVARRNASR